MSVAQAAQKVIDFYESRGGEKAWTQGKWARDEDGYQVPVRSNDAVCWCIDGAIGAAIGWTTDEARELMDELNSTQREAGISRWNDEPGRTYAEVIDLLRKIATSEVTQC